MGKFVQYPTFHADILRASNKSRSSLRPLFDQVRSVTDKIYFNARSAIQREMGRAEAEMQGYRSSRFSRNGKRNYQYAKAKHAALKTAYNSTVPTMGFDGNEIYGRVAINRKYSFTVEFGGIDPVGQVGKGTGEFVNHPSYSFLRRAMNQS